MEGKQQKDRSTLTMYSLLTNKRIRGSPEERVPEVFLKPSGQVIKDTGVEVVIGGFLDSAWRSQFSECRGPDSNRHGEESPADFKSAASAIPPPRHTGETT